MRDKQLILIFGIVLVLGAVVIVSFNRKDKTPNKIEGKVPSMDRVVVDKSPIRQEDRDFTLYREATLVTEQRVPTTVDDIDSTKSDSNIETLLRQSRDFEYLAQHGNPQALAIAFSQIASEELREEIRTGLWDTVGDLQVTLSSPEAPIIQDEGRIKFLIFASAFCEDEKAFPVLEELQNTIRLQLATQTSEQPVFSDPVKLQSDITYAFAKISKNSREAMKKVFLEFESGDSIVKERILSGLAGNTSKEAKMLIDKGLASSEEGVKEAAQRTFEINSKIQKQ